MGNYKKYGLFVLVCFIFGNTFLAISLGLRAGASPLYFAATRFFSAGVLMLIPLILLKKASLRTIRNLFLRSFILSLFLITGTFGLMFIAQTRVDSGFMARLDATGPLITAFLAAMLLRKKLNWIHIAALLLGTAGTFLIASPASGADPLYLLAAAGSVVFYALGNILYPLLFTEKEDPVLISALQNIFGGLVLGIAAFATGSTELPKTVLGPLLYLIIAGSIIAQTGTLILVKTAGPVFASGWLYVAPVIATLSGVLVLNEAISVEGITGTLLALGGTFLLGKAESGRSTPARDLQGESAVEPAGPERAGKKKDL